MRWLADSPSVTNQAYCDGCKAQRNEETLCDECPAHDWLAILPENEAACWVFYRAWRQWHLGTHVVNRGDQVRKYPIPIAMRMEGFEALARALNVEWNEDLLDKLQVMEAERIKAERERCDGHP